MVGAIQVERTLGGGPTTIGICAPPPHGGDWVLRALHLGSDLAHARRPGDFGDQIEPEDGTVGGCPVASRASLAWRWLRGR